MQDTKIVQAWKLFLQDRLHENFNTVVQIRDDPWITVTILIPDKSGTQINKICPVEELSSIQIMT